MRILWVLCALFLVNCTARMPQVDRFREVDSMHLLIQAHADLKHQNYQDAAERFEGFSTHFPEQNLAKEAQLNAIYARFMLKDSAMVETLSDQYLHRYLHDVGTSYVMYLRALSPLLKHGSFLQQVTAYKPATHGAVLFRQSFRRLRAFVYLYPRTVYAGRAMRLLVFLKHSIALQSEQVSEYYLNRGAYEAALNRATDSLSISLNRTTAEPALQVMLKAYQHLGLHVQARRVQSILNQAH